uniref:Tetratricopeptide repeat protein n=1 Tax=Guillardia theta (strain CCMP2712) TaxID=905079 RepID=A0A0C3U4F1_GUITC
MEKNGKAIYMEYPDTFVQRGLCSEGLGNWEDAIQDYSRAIQLWGGGREQGVNPYVLTFRANALAKLGKYNEALVDYEASDRLFVAVLRDEARALDVRANYALALYQADDLRLTMFTADPLHHLQLSGYTDMHVALAAIAWSAGDRETAESEWEFACNKIQTGCSLYRQSLISRDLDWLSTVRRWPPAMVANMALFLGKK